MPVWRVQFGACQFDVTQFGVTHFGAIPLWRVPLWRVFVTYHILVSLVYIHALSGSACDKCVNCDYVRNYVTVCRVDILWFAVAYMHDKVYVYTHVESMSWAASFYLCCITINTYQCVVIGRLYYTRTATFLAAGSERLGQRALPLFRSSRLQQNYLGQFQLPAGWPALQTLPCLLEISFQPRRSRRSRHTRGTTRLPSSEARRRSTFRYVPTIMYLHKKRSYNNNNNFIEDSINLCSCLLVKCSYFAARCDAYTNQ